jgi:hypothetical protein
MIVEEVFRALLLTTRNLPLRPLDIRADDIRYPHLQRAATLLPSLAGRALSALSVDESPGTALRKIQQFHEKMTFVEGYGLCHNKSKRHAWVPSTASSDP